MLENIDHSSSKKILDIGCCESLLPEELGKRGHMVFGIDIRDYGRCRNFKFLKADITKRDSLPKESFQTLISGYFQIEKQQFWIPKSKKNWIAASKEEVEKEYAAYRESNNACFVLKKYSGGRRCQVKSRIITKIR